MTLNWSDSDSSIDSLPSSSSDNSDNEEDWPERTGFHVCLPMGFKSARNDEYCACTEIKINIKLEVF